MRKTGLWILLLLSACSASAPVNHSGDLSAGDGWQTGSLQTAGFDLDKMRALDQRIDDGFYINVHMILVEYDGKLVYEKYLSGEDESWGNPVGVRQFDVDSRHDLRSISKSVTALLLGIALGDDYEAALSRPIIEYFPEYADQIAPGAEKITLHHVLTMSTGHEWNEMDITYASLNNDERRMYYASDPVEFLLTRPLKAVPGRDWYYNGGTTMVLAALVAKLSGQEFLDFAREKLADPLGIDLKDVEWRGLGIWQRRLPAASSGLRMRARDLAKIGSLMLHDGKWQGRQVVPAGWVRASSRRHMEQTYSIWSENGVYGYGYQWWHGKFEGAWGNFNAVTGVGYGGQRLFILPEEKLVVTVLAGNYGNGIYLMGERLLSRIVAAAP